MKINFKQLEMVIQNNKPVSVMLPIFGERGKFFIFNQSKQTNDSMKQINLLLPFFFLFLFACNDSAKEKKTAPSVQLTKEYLQKGEQLYRSKCMNCHLQTGKGIPGFYPPLANSDYLQKKRDASLHMVKFGGSKPIKVNGKEYKGIMPAAGLSDQDITVLFNYILNAWGNDYGTVGVEEVKAIKE